MLFDFIVFYCILLYFIVFYCILLYFIVYLLFYYLIINILFNLPASVKSFFRLMFS